MFLGIIFVIIGILFLYFGAEVLVKGAARLAISLGITPLVVGATVVALGTSLPELMASVIALFQGKEGDMALGNVIGSNIANIGLILGIGALIRPIEVPKDSKKREIPFMIFVSLLLGGLMMLGPLSWLAGLLLFVLLIFYIYLQIKVSQKHRQAYWKRVSKKETKEIPKLTSQEAVKDITLVSMGLIALFFGGYFLVDGAITVARLFDISERVIGLTILAFGTSCPELATVVVASLRKEHDLSIGNIVGSNIFNILLIISVCALVKPMVFEAKLLSFDVPVMLLFTGLLCLFVYRRSRINRWEGGVLLAGYCTYFYWILQQNGFGI